MKKLLVVFALVAFAAAGCAQKAVTKPEAEKTTEQKEAAEKAPEKVTEQKTAAKESVTSMEKETTGMEETEGLFKDLLFDFDKYDVKDEYKPELKSIAEWMTKHAGAKLSIEGHCDERGTNEYNLALGDKRAKAVKDYLVSLGVPSDRLETISYGEEKPLCTEHTEDCWAKNRRAHFVALGKAGK
ncbi:MAG: peptidoglycan-associated lipoprotein Pal [Nitrospiraceae bacterium]|nr:peptidoglycan-associated lipoprotein Pal [Nitrospiraceae bacterium]